MHVDVAPINDGSHSFTCHQHVYPRMEGAILRLLPSRRAALHFGRYSVPVRWRVGGWVGLGEPRKTGQLRISWGSVFVRRLPARCRLGSSSSSSVVGQFQVLNYEHQFTSRQSCIFLLLDQEFGTVWLHKSISLSVFARSWKSILLFEAPAPSDCCI